MNLDIRERLQHGAANISEEVIDEICWLMGRLRSMGFEGDCGYERGLASVYESRLNRLLESVDCA